MNGDNSDMLRVLVKTRELLADGWCKGAFAKNKDGRVVDWRSDDACSFCADGALGRALVSVFPEQDDSMMSHQINDLVIMIGQSIGVEFWRNYGGYISNWNDDSASPEAVLRVFDASIANLRENGNYIG